MIPPLGTVCGLLLCGVGFILLAGFNRPLAIEQPNRGWFMYQRARKPSTIACLNIVASTDAGLRFLDYGVKSILSLVLVLAMVLIAGCAGWAPGPSFDSIAEEFVYGTLALSPASATQSGYHQHQGKTLDDFSAAGIAAQRQFYTGFRARLDKWNASRLTPGERADFQILSDQIALARSNWTASKAIGTTPRCT